VPEDIALYVAAGAAGIAAVALVLALLAWMRLRRVRQEQRILLPDGLRDDLIGRQAALQRAVDGIDAGLRDLQTLTGEQLARTDEELRSALRFQGLVRYDAYSEMGGQQSWSIALLDSRRDGAVISCLHARDHARVYMKEVAGGVAGQRLSPEEQRAMALALGDPERAAAAPPTEEQAVAPVAEDAATTPGEEGAA
jgi:hypothetical protein